VQQFNGRVEICALSAARTGSCRADEKVSCGADFASRCCIPSIIIFPVDDNCELHNFSLCGNCRIKEDFYFMDFERSKKLMQGAVRQGSFLGLERVSALLKLLGDPQEKVRCVHVAGTNGKGSVVEMTAQILHAAGYKTGRYISPALFEFNERVSINGVNITDSELKKLFASAKNAAKQLEKSFGELPTEFEFVTALAFLYFAEKKCDIVVLETGLGGRLDATNAIQNPVSVIITAIGFDHMKELGDTLEQIAGEKAGIIKPGSDVVSYVQEPEAAKVIETRCKETGSRLYIAENEKVSVKSCDRNGLVFDYGDLKDLRLSLCGDYQSKNVAVVLKNIEVLRQKGFEISDSAIRKGLHKAVWPGRMAFISKKPVVLFDGAHNLHGVKALTSSLKQMFPNQKFIFVMGVLADKDYREMIAEFTPLAAHVITVAPPNPRALLPDELAKNISGYVKNVHSANSIKKGIAEAKALQKKTGLPICCFGSLYSAKEVYDCFPEAQKPKVTGHEVLKMVVTMALMIALEIVLHRFLSIKLPTVQFHLGFLPIAALAILYGPWAGLAWGIAEFLGAILFPVGAYFPGFTISSALFGVVLGLFLYRYRYKFWKVVVASVICTIAFSLCLDTFWLVQFFGQGFIAILPIRLIKAGVLIVLQIALIPPLHQLLKKQKLL